LLVPIFGRLGGEESYVFLKPSEAPKKPMQSMWFKKKHPIEIHNSLDYFLKEKKLCSTTFTNSAH
jgi:hypothetical protein